MKEIQGTAGAIWALTASGFAGIIRNVFFWITMAYAAIVVTIHIVEIVTVSAFARDDPGMREYLLSWVISSWRLRAYIAWLASVAVVIVVAIVGTRTVSRDRMLGGLEFILSKSIPPWGYVVARTLAPVLAALAVLFLPLLVSALIVDAILDDLPGASRRLLWSAVGAAAVIAVTLGVLAAGLGSLVGSPRKAVVLWLVIVWATLPLGAIAQELGADWAWLVGPLALLYGTTQTFLGIGFPGQHTWHGWLGIFLLIAVSLAVMRWRVREVVR